MKTASGATVTFSHFEVGEKEEGVDMFPIYFVATNGLRYILSPYGERLALYLKEDMRSFETETAVPLEYSDAIEIPYGNDAVWDPFENNVGNAVLLAYLQKRFPGNQTLYVLKEVVDNNVRYNVYDDAQLLTQVSCEEGSWGNHSTRFYYGKFAPETAPLIAQNVGDDTESGYCDCNKKIIMDGDAASGIGATMAYVVPWNLAGATAQDLIAFNYAMLSGIDISSIANIPSRCGIPMV